MTLTRASHVNHKTGAAAQGERQVSGAQFAVGHEALAELPIAFILESRGGGPWPRPAVEECARAGVYTARVSWK
jgi:hypothetical protein